jgi:hypothetical protein
LKYFLRRIRRRLKKPAVGIGIAAAVLVLSLVLIMMRMDSGGPTYRKVGKYWFYDLSTKELFPAYTSAVPPIEAPSKAAIDGQPSGVRAFVFGCGDCKETFIGYLQKYLPEGKTLMANMNDELRQRKAAKFSRIASPDDVEWHPDGGDEAGAVVHKAMTRCPKGSKTAVCDPS